MSLQWEDEVQPVKENINAVLGRGARRRGDCARPRNLVEGGYLRPGPQPRTGDTIGPVTVRLTEKALKRVAGWPATTGDALLASLIAELNKQIEAAEPEERSKLEQFHEFAIGAGRDTLIAFFTALGTAQAQKYAPN
jgi:hypothetical protein